MPASLAQPFSTNEAVEAEYLHEGGVCEGVLSVHKHGVRSRLRNLRRIDALGRIFHREGLSTLGIYCQVVVH